mgnify:FL=1
MKNELSLFAITTEIESLDQILESLQGEVTEDFEVLEAEISAILTAKTDGCTSYLNYLKNKVKEIKARKKELATQADDMVNFYENKIKSFEEYVHIVIDKLGVKSIVGEHSKISKRKPSKSVNIIDKDKIPPEFLEVVQTITIKKQEIAKLLKAGEDVAGAELLDSTKKSISIAKV